MGLPRITLGLGLVVTLLIAGCGGAAQGTAVVAPMAAPPPLRAVAPGLATPAIVPKAPAGYVEMKILGVTPAGGAARVELVDPSEKIVLRIFVGGTEGHSINLRSEKRRPERPLTHDLLDRVLHELDAEILQAQVDDLKNGVFLGTLVLRRGDKTISIDARPSDVIALAIGTNAPIYVAKHVLAEAGVARNEGDEEESTVRGAASP